MVLMFLMCYVCCCVEYGFNGSNGSNVSNVSNGSNGSNVSYVSMGFFPTCFLQIMCTRAAA